MKIKVFLLLLALCAVFSAYRLWYHPIEETAFECRARLYAKKLSSENSCYRNSAVDFYLSLNKQNKGYMLVSGTITCPHKKNRIINNTMNFDYQKEGSYYIIHMQETDEDLSMFSEIFRDHDRRIKLLPMNSGDVVISSPVGALLMCTQQ